ncbi:MAG TPA: hypothetical protein VFG49_01780 [Dyella sp.]|uniref:hypothetical protein n=1 Tax=Dyella sp. TaxID=1869338 RepID=UPI002D77C7DA|nr:hypothetical protein [Dyella sp.]HET6552242.1 hypothetical protein [Dyella sp.]
MVTYSLKQSAEGQWNVCRSGSLLFSQLQLSAAIKLAREVAREEYLRSGHPVCVEMPGPESTIRLARFDQPTPSLVQAA